MTSVRLLEPIPDPREEARELTEHQRAMAAGDYVVELFDERVELRAGNGIMLGIHERGVEAQKTQPGDGPKDRDPVALEVVEQSQDSLALALEVRVVHLAVTRMQLDLERLLLLGREFGGHELLGSPLEQRLNASSLLGEPLRVWEEAGCGECQQRPQLDEISPSACP
jgi:hypothetical protein